jgi:hypothetical protein
MSILTELFSDPYSSSIAIILYCQFPGNHPFTKSFFRCRIFYCRPPVSAGRYGSIGVGVVKRPKLLKTIMRHKELLSPFSSSIPRPHFPSRFRNATGFSQEEKSDGA